MREDLTTTDETVADLDQDVNFLFDEQVIQDERLLNLEEASVQVVLWNSQRSMPIFKVGVCAIMKSNHCNFIVKRYQNIFYQCVISFAQILRQQLWHLDFRVTALEENGGSDGNSSVAELEVRVETLEGTAADHETRLTTAESDIEGKILQCFKMKKKNYQETNSLFSDLSKMPVIVYLRNFCEKRRRIYDLIYFPAMVNQIDCSWRKYPR